MARLFTIVSGDEELTIDRIYIPDPVTPTVAVTRWDFVYTKVDLPEKNFLSFHSERAAQAALAAWMNIADPQAVRDAEEIFEKIDFLPSAVAKEKPSDAIPFESAFLFPIKKGIIFHKEGGFGFTVYLRDDPYTHYVVPSTISSLFHAKAAVVNFVRMVNSRLDGK